MAIKRLFADVHFMLFLVCPSPPNGIWRVFPTTQNVKKKIVALAFLHLKPDMQKRADLAEETMLIF